MIYEYECKSCGTKHEVHQGINDTVLRICPKCNQDALVKIISLSHFVFKGDGFPSNDIKNKRTTK